MNAIVYACPQQPKTQRAFNTVLNQAENYAFFAAAVLFNVVIRGIRGGTREVGVGEFLFGRRLHSHPPALRIVIDCIMVAVWRQVALMSFVHLCSRFVSGFSYVIGFNTARTAAFIVGIISNSALFVLLLDFASFEQEGF